MAEKAYLPIVVVGVDGSEASARALRWARDYAALAHARLRVVTAWHFHPGFGFPPVVPVSDEVPARRALEHTTAAVLGSPPRDGVEEELAEGSPRQVLVDASRDAALLVVGSRGLGGVAGMLLGSVSEYCARHAHCPVVIVR